MQVNRRQFLHTAAAAAATTPFVGCSRTSAAERHLRPVRRPAMGLHGRRRTSLPEDAQHRSRCERRDPVLERVLHELAVLAEPGELPERPLRARTPGHQQLHRVPVEHHRAIRSACTTPATRRRISASGTWARGTTKSARDSTTGPAIKGRGSTTTRSSTSMASDRSSKATTPTSSRTWRPTG